MGSKHFQINKKGSDLVQSTAFKTLWLRLYFYSREPFARTTSLGSTVAYGKVNPLAHSSYTVRTSSHITDQLIVFRSSSPGLKSTFFFEKVYVAVVGM